MCKGKGQGARRVPIRKDGWGQVKITVNGKEKTISENTTVEKLLADLNIKPQGIAVEKNLEIVPKSKYSETVLKNGDRVEVVRMLGGG